MTIDANLLLGLYIGTGIGATLAFGVVGLLAWLVSREGKR